MTTALQKKMFQERDHKKAFDLAVGFSYQYMDEAQQRHVYPNTEALTAIQDLESSINNNGHNAEEIVTQLHQIGAPATVTMTGGRYFGFVNGSVIPVSLAARWMADAWDQNTALYVISPIASKLESICERWLKELLRLPQNAVAGFVSGTSVAILCGLAAARYRIFQQQGWDINQQGFIDAPRLRIIAGTHAHGTVLKAISLLGFGLENVEWVDVDDQGRICADKLPTLDDSCIVILQAGNVCSGAFDDFSSICKKANEAKAWVHIDGAFGLWAAATTDYQYLTKGIELANSFSVDGHKTLNTPYDNGIVLCNDQEALTNALHATGSYITYSENRDGMMYTPEMSRRARSVELWAALKYLGKEGVNSLVSTLCERAQQAAELLQQAGFEVLNDVVFNQVMVACEDEDLTEKVMIEVQKSGICWAGGAQWFGRKIIRISVCSWATTTKDIEMSVQAFIDARAKVTKENENINNA